MGSVDGWRLPEIRPNGESPGSSLLRSALRHASTGEAADYHPILSTTRPAANQWNPGIYESQNSDTPYFRALSDEIYSDMKNMARRLYASTQIGRVFQDYCLASTRGPSPTSPKLNYSTPPALLGPSPSLHSTNLREDEAPSPARTQKQPSAQPSPFRHRM